jgi:exodeoxyribonuclease V beta subunit
MVFDLCCESDAKERLNAERMSEHQRLLYVALTRPIFKLYIPKIKKPASASQFLGPLGTILLPALELACPDKLSPLIVDIVTPTLAGRILKATSVSEKSAPIPPPAPFTVESPLFPVIDSNISKRRIVTRSFSSMAKHHLSLVGERSSFGEQVSPSEDETGTPLDREDPLRGPVFGDMVHNVLEKIDFAEVGRAGKPDDLWKVGTHARKLLDQEIRANIALLRTRTPIDLLDQACRQQIASLVWHTLHTPLAEIGGRLCEIPAGDRLAEVEFLYPEKIESRFEERFITGYMDLLFRKNHKYYLVDWKTNLLPGYSREQIERSMTDSDYHRQYRLYVQGIARWLHRVHGRDYSFPKLFGGVYYLYVRGLNGRDETTGAYFHRPTAQDLDLNFVLNH